MIRAIQVLGFISAGLLITGAGVSISTGDNAWFLGAMAVVYGPWAVAYGGLRGRRWLDDRARRNHRGSW